MQENMDQAKPNEAQKSGTYKTSRSIKLQGEPVPNQLNPTKMAVKEMHFEAGAEAKWESDDLEEKPANDS